MRRFAKNIGLMMLALATWVAGMNSLQVRRMKASIPDGKTTLVIGDSHSTGFKDSNLLNLSVPGEPLPIQVGKALIALDEVPFDYVICAVGPQTASSEPLRLMNNELNWVSGHQGQISLIAWAEPQVFTLTSSKTSCTGLLNIFNWNKGVELNNRFQDQGTSSDLSEARTTKRLQQHDVLKSNWYCDAIRFYKTLSLIADACHKSGTTLHLIETPYHQSYRSQIQPDDYAKFKSDITTFCLGHEYVSYSDFSNSNYPDDHFSDADHLNQRGFQRFMREEFQSLLN